MKNRFSRRLTLNKCSAAILVAMLSTFSAGSVSASPQDERPLSDTIEFDVPQQPLADALQAFSRASGQQVSFASAAVEGMSSNAVSGTFSTQEALRLMLEGKGLDFQLGSQGEWLITPRARATVDPDVTDIRGMVVTEVGPPRRTSGGALGGRSDRDTPFSLSNVDLEDLEERQAATLEDAFEADASVSRASTGNEFSETASYLLVRGLPVDTLQGVKINGVPGGYIFGVNLPLTSMDSVQLLKGSSAFMYGFSSPGGIINYRTKQPTTYNLKRFSLGYRSDSLFSQNADLSGPVAGRGQMGYRLNLSNEQGYGYNESHLDRTGVTFTLTGKVNDRLSWSFDAMGQVRDIKRPTPYNLFWSEFYDSDRLPDLFSGSVNTAADDSRSHNKYHYLTSSLYWQMADDWNLTVSASTSRSKLRAQREYFYYRFQETGGYYNYAMDFMNDYRSHFAQALVQGSFMTGGIRHETTFGLSYVTLSNFGADTNYYPGRFYVGTGYIFDPTRMSPNYGEWSDPDVARISGRYQRVAFASNTMHFNDRWSLLGGLRFTDYSQFASGAREQAPDGSVIHEYDRYAVTSLTPTVAVMYQPNEGTSIYASYVESLEPGSVVSEFYVNQGEVLDPMTSKQYELGFKYDSANWGANAAIFRMERGTGYGKALLDDSTPPDPDDDGPPPSPSLEYVQDGIDRYDGAEASITAHLTDNLRVIASGTYLNSNYKEMEPDNLRLGREVIGTAKWSGALSLRYRVPWIEGLSIFGYGRVRSDVTISHYDRVEDGEPALLTIRGPGYARYNAGASYSTRIGSYPVTFRLYATNIFDRDHFHGTRNYFSAGQPRSYSANVYIRF